MLTKSDKSNFVMAALDHLGNAKKLLLAEYQAMEKTSDTLVWVKCQLDGNTRKKLKHLKVIPASVITTLCAEETRPRCFIHQGGLVANFRTTTANACKDNSGNTASIRLWLTENMIVTVQRYPLESLHKIQDNLQTGYGPKSACEFLMAILTHFNDGISDTINLLADDINQIEEQPRITYANRTQLASIRRQVVILRRYLLPQREAILKIQPEELSWFSANSHSQLREIADSVIRLLEDLDAERDRTIILQEEITVHAQEKINNKMFVLAVVTVIFLPLSFVTGLLGINVAGIPGASYKHAFYIVCALLLMLVVFEWLLLRKKHWF